jgi:hypothetical protein
MIKVHISMSILFKRGGVIMDGKKVEHEKEWVVRFLNLPPKDQVDFLFRFKMEESIRKDIEKKVFGK